MHSSFLWAPVLNSCPAYVFVFFATGSGRWGNTPIVRKTIGEYAEKIVAKGIDLYHELLKDQYFDGKAREAKLINIDLGFCAVRTTQLVHIATLFTYVSFFSILFFHLRFVVM